jgi:hypothetical protein
MSDKFDKYIASFMQWSESMRTVLLKMSEKKEDK